ncbi:hypothetical protein [Pedosphaera parvula]|uniref:Uncharacterized protein n=1 Tax=Pedosphaera parvula (strain Ellin514) TaxID=320771 RepID=B9XDH0_PEDPL|nr:hypothetical protein [Pedosphaera parvula]EEF62116.1 hypothetical protein Cflav_PD6391 [Pedosphaera parvula Ellin514]
MGIFSDDTAEDISSLQHIAQASVNFYNSTHSKHSHAVEVDAVEVKGDFDHISTVGGRILREYFTSPTALHRVAVLLILSNAFPVFGLKRKGRPLLSLNERKAFLSQFTCLFVQAALSTMTLESEGQSYSLKWNGFPNDEFRDQFLTYLEWIDPAKVEIKANQEKVQKDHTKILAHLVLGAAMMLPYCVVQQLQPPPPDNQLSSHGKPPLLPGA